MSRHNQGRKWRLQQRQTEFALVEGLMLPGEHIAKYENPKPSFYPNRPTKRRRKELKQNRHHLKNKCRGGDFSPQNLIWLDVNKHGTWHRVFRNSDPEYIIAVLKRMCRMKGYPLRESK